MKIRLAARKSELAQLQARQVGQAIQRVFPQSEISYHFRESLGDRNLEDPLWKMPEKGVFTEDFYQDLMSGEVDLVVHSWKDLPTVEKEATYIAATLPRADQRDLLLFKKKSLGKKAIQIFSSSPRRAYNLGGFLKASLPGAANEISFQNIRGNIATRIKKFIADDSVDGLVLAKAAADRLLSTAETQQTAELIRGIISNELWMVLPLSANPNAAAQGALAVEARRDRRDLLEILQKINCESSFAAATQERKLLMSYGGGCHLALGMAVVQRPYGTVTWVRGVSPGGKEVELRYFDAKKKLPEAIETKKINCSWSRKPIPFSIGSEINALYVSKFEAWPAESLKNYRGVVWTAGLSTWARLAKANVWVNGSAESLGESEAPLIASYFSEPLSWGLLTHSQAQAGLNKKNICTYEAVCEVDESQSEVDFKSIHAYHWSSVLEYQAALRRWPQLEKQIHICGPGRTHSSLKELLGGDENLYIQV